MNDLPQVTVRIEQPPAPPPATVVIEMTGEQAVAVARVLARHTSSEKLDTFSVFSRLRYSLEDAGLRP